MSRALSFGVYFALTLSAVWATAFTTLIEDDLDPVLPLAGLFKVLPPRWTPLDHAVGLYNNADSAPITPLLLAAQRTIDIEIYEMEDPDVLAALVGALKRGLKVRIIKDPRPIGQRCDPFHLDPKRPDCPELKSWISAFKKAGGELRAFDRQNLCGIKGKPCFEHGKLILVDDQLAVISTGNFNITNLCDRKFRPRKCNRDYTYITRDKESVAALTKIFAGDWRGDAGGLEELVKSNQLPNKITVSPFSRAPLMRFIASAKKSLRIQNQYITDENVGARLIDLKKERPGLKIQVNLSDVCEYGKVTETKRYKARLMFQAFNDVGIETRMFPKTQLVGERKGYLHAKAIVVDDERAWIGSVNGSSTSLDQNREFGIFFAQPTRVKELAQQLDADFRDPHSITWNKSVLECPTIKLRRPAESDEI